MADPEKPTIIADSSGSDQKFDSAYSDPDADFVITSSDDVSFRIHKYFLCAASPVFRDMTRDCGSNKVAEIPLTDSVIEHSEIIRLLLNLICNKPFTNFDHVPCIDMLNLIRLSQKFDCASVLQTISLHLTQPTDDRADVFNRFYYACALDNVVAAHRYLPLAAALTWPDRAVPGPVSVHACSNGASKLDVTAMSSVWIDQLPRKYFLALLRASSQVYMRHGWTFVAEEFKAQIKLQA